MKIPIRTRATRTSVSCGSHTQRLRSDEEDEEQECDSGLFLTDLFCQNLSCEPTVGLEMI